MPEGSPDRREALARTVALDWITIWQSEVAAMAGDREVQEGWVRLVELWAGAARAAVRLLPPAGADRFADNAPGSARADATAGPSPAMAASDPRDAEIRRLAERIERLERSLAAAGPAGGT